MDEICNYAGLWKVICKAQLVSWAQFENGHLLADSRLGPFWGMTTYTYRHSNVVGPQNWQYHPLDWASSSIWTVRAYQHGNLWKRTIFKRVDPPAPVRGPQLILKLQNQINNDLKIESHEFITWWIKLGHQLYQRWYRD